MAVPRIPGERLVPQHVAAKSAAGYVFLVNRLISAIDC
jgi:hypothetical protein